MSDEGNVGPPTTELYISKDWVYNYIRKALSDALSVEVEHFSIGFSYHSSSRGAGVGAVSSNDLALHELDPIKISEMIRAHRIKDGTTLVHPAPLHIVKP